MERILLDTVHLRQDFPAGSITLLHQHKWGRSIETNKGQRPVTCFRISEDGVALRVYENIYRHNRLVIIVSIPRASKGNNYNNITKAELPLFFNKVYDVLYKYIEVKNPMRLLLVYFEVDRCDLFYMLSVPAHLKQEYLNAFSKLHLGQYVDEQCGTTTYYKSSKHYYGKKNQASVVSCFYDKELEMYQKENPELYNEFQAIQGELLHNQSPSTVRIEIRLMRNKLRRLFNNSKFVTLQDIFNPAFQRAVLDSYFDRFRLYDEILTKDDYYTLVPTMFAYKSSRANAIDFADSIRKGNSITLSPNEARYVKQILHDHQIHYVTTPKYTLMPIDRQSVIGNGALYDILGDAAEAALQTVLKHRVVSDLDEPFVFLA